MEDESCWACKSSLRPGQKVCTECNSWQNWRRIVNISNSTLALVVALVSVTTLGFSNVTRAILESSKSNEIPDFSGFVYWDDVTGALSFEMQIVNKNFSPLYVQNEIPCELEGVELSFYSVSGSRVEAQSGPIFRFRSNHFDQSVADQVLECGVIIERNYGALFEDFRSQGSQTMIRMLPWAVPQPGQIQGFSFTPGEADRLI